jgi:SAM-dependent methyltransferase
MTAATDRQSTVTGHFDRYAEGDRWGALYDPVNPASHSFLARRDAVVELMGDVRGACVLDLGCGSGALAGSLRNAGLERYAGIDLAPRMIEGCRANLEHLEVGPEWTADVGDVTALDFPDAHFDRVIGMGLIEYFDDPRTVVREALRVARPGALLVFTIPHRACLNEWVIRAASPFRALGRTHKSGERADVRRDTYTPARFRALFEELGAPVVDERYYNRLVLPYPFTRLVPRTARAAARWAEPKRGLAFTATGYIAAARVPVR